MIYALDVILHMKKKCPFYYFSNLSPRRLNQSNVVDKVLQGLLRGNEITEMEELLSTGGVKGGSWARKGRERLERSGRHMRTRLLDVLGSLLPRVVASVDQEAFLLKSHRREVEGEHVCLGNVTDVDEPGGWGGWHAALDQHVGVTVGAKV